MGGGDSPQAPQPSAEELELQRLQTDILRQQQFLVNQQLGTQNLLAPFAYEQLGLSPTYAEGLSPEQAQQQQQLMAQRDALLAQLQQLDASAPAGQHSLDAVHQAAALQPQLRQVQTSLADLERAGQRRITGFERLPPTADQLRQQEVMRAIQEGTLSSLQREQEAAPLLLRQRELQNLITERGLASMDEEARRRALEEPILARQRDLQTAFMERSLADLEAQAGSREANLEIENLLRQRTLAGLKGELPVNPGLQRELLQQEDVLRESLSRQLGSGFETSTPGIQALAEFNQRKSEILEAARRGDITLGEQLGFARDAARNERINAANQPLALGLQRSQMGTAQSIADIGLGLQRPYTDALDQSGMGLNTLQLGAGLRQQQLGNLYVPTSGGLAGAGALGGVAQGFSGPLSFFGNLRNQQFQASAMNAQSNAQSQMGYGQLFGTILGAYLGGPAGAVLTNRLLS